MARSRTTRRTSLRRNTRRHSRKEPLKPAKQEPPRLSTRKSSRRTKRTRSKLSEPPVRRNATFATASMSLVELQMMAKSRGIPFGGLSKNRLARAINNYNK